MEPDSRSFRRPSPTAWVVCAGIAMFLLAVGVMAQPGAQREYENAKRFCQSDPLPVECQGDGTAVDDSLQPTIIGLDASLLAGILLAAAAVTVIAGLLPVHFRGVAFLVASVTFLLATGATEYASCSDPGYNDASSAQIRWNRALLASALLTPLVAFLQLAATMLVVRRHWGAHLLSVAACLLAFLIVGGYAVVSGTC